MGAVLTVKEYLLSPWIQLLLVAVLAASILIMMPPRRGTGRGNSQQDQPNNPSKAAPPKARTPVTNYRPLEDPNDGITQAYRADRGLILSDGWGHIEYIEGRAVYHDQYNCTELQYREAFRVLFELPDRHNVPHEAVQAIARGLTVGYESIRYYEKAFLQVQKDLFEGADLNERLQTEMYKVDELSSAMADQDAHIQELEERKINADHANKVWTDSLQETINDLTEQLDKKKADLRKLHKAMDDNDRELNSEITELAVDRQEALVKYQFACDSHAAEISALKAEDERVRAQLREAYTQRDEYIALAHRLLDENYRPEEVNVADYAAMKNHLATVEVEHTRNIHHLEQAQDVNRRYKSQLP